MLSILEADFFKMDYSILPCCLDEQPGTYASCLADSLTGRQRGRGMFEDELTSLQTPGLAQVEGLSLTLLVLPYGF